MPTEPSEVLSEVPSVVESFVEENGPAKSETRIPRETNRVAEWRSYVATFDRPNEVVERRDTYARHFRDPDGGFTALISPSPIQYRHPDGSWQPVDLELRHENGRYVNCSNVLKSEFPEISTDPDGARIGLSPEESYQWRPLSMGFSDPAGRYTSVYVAASVPARAGAGELEYAGLFPNATDRFRVESSLVKHDLILTQAPPLPGSIPTGGTFDYMGEVTLAPGLAFELGSRFTSSEGAWVVNQKGERLFELAAPLAREVGGHGASAGMYRVRPVSDDRYELSIQIPAGWLTDPARKFPVEIDPTTTTNGVRVDNSYAYGIDDPRDARFITVSDYFRWSSWRSGSWGFANSDGYGGSYSYDCAVGLDFDWENEFYHSAVDWNTSSIPDDHAIGKVSVRIKVAPYNYGDGDGHADDFDGDSVDVFGRSMTYSWIERGARKQYVDCEDGDWYLGVQLHCTPGSSNTTAWIEMGTTAVADLQRQLGNNWFGLGLVPQDVLGEMEPGRDPIDEDRSDRGVITWLHQSPLEVTYSRPPSKPTLLSPSDGQMVYGNSVTFSWNPSTDLDGTTVTYVLSVSGKPYPVGTATSYTVSDLLPGYDYTWLVIASDGIVSAYSEPRAFHLNGAPPAPYRVGITHHSNGVGVTWGAGGPDPEGDSYQYRLQISTSSAFTSNIVNTTTAFAYQWVSLSTLNRTYYWRVRVEDAHGAKSNWSSVGSFVH